MGPTEIFRPTFSRILAIAVWVILAIIAVSAVVGVEGSFKWRVLALTAFAAIAVWLFYLRPEVEVSDGGLRLRNPLKETQIPWPAVQELAINGTFEVTDRSGIRHSAYAAPIKNKRHDLGIAGEVKAFSDHRLDVLTQAGFLENIRSEGAPVKIVKNRLGATILSLSAALFVVTLLV